MKVESRGFGKEKRILRSVLVAERWGLRFGVWGWIGGGWGWGLEGGRERCWILAFGGGGGGVVNVGRLFCC